MCVCVCVCVCVIFEKNHYNKMIKIILLFISLSEIIIIIVTELYIIIQKKKYSSAGPIPFHKIILYRTIRK